MVFQVSGEKKICSSINYFGRMVIKLEKLVRSQTQKKYILKIPDELKSTRNINKTKEVVEENVRD